MDSASGGIPSPIIDGRLIPLPIPAEGERTGIKYSDLVAGSISLGKLVEDLSSSKIRKSSLVHLDPDLDKALYRRLPGWRPVFGQSKAAQTHLKNQGVTIGDLFLFFGWFMEAELHSGKYRYKPGAPHLHVIFGWLQVGTVVDLDHSGLSWPQWAKYHPHFRGKYGTAYIACERLQIGSLGKVSGGGYFKRYHDSLRLTDPEQRCRSLWRLPKWFMPTGDRPPLTYHSHDCFQWQNRFVRLAAVGRGQEFVLDGRHYREMHSWGKNLFTKALEV